MQKFAPSYFVDVINNADKPLERLYGVEDFVSKPGDKKLYRVTFKIKSDYKWGSGWSDVDIKKIENYEMEVVELFKGLGCRIAPGSAASADTAVFSHDESLYLHPMEFTGIVSFETAKEVFDTLNKEHENFEFMNFTAHSEVYDWSAAEYITFLNSDFVKPKIKKDLIKLTAENSHPSLSGIAMELNEKYKLPVLCESALTGLSSSDLTYKFILDMEDGTFDKLHAMEIKILNNNINNGPVM